MPTEKYQIDVAASVIADISAGIYRSPAGAIKELISNAFDADATTVHVSTGASNFTTFTCSDDGIGMSPGKFKEIMQFIGGSSKRDGGELTGKYHRPLVGRIGIGILSIGQICRRIEIFSSVEGSSKKFHATIDLAPYMRPEAQRQNLGQRLSESKTVKIGEYEIEEADESPGKHYTRVIMESIIPGFRQQLLDEPIGKLGVTPKTFKKGEMPDFLQSVSQNNVKEHGAYAQLIWELAATIPVKYMNNGPIKNEHKLDDLRERLEKYNFRVFLDGVELFKPISLPFSSTVEHKVYPNLNLTKKLSDGRTLKVRGYIYWQNSRILPRELQGVLIRVRNVGIGAFDPTYLGYPRHEGWKFSQINGELYVDEGLDEAINIDRSSFRESDEGFIALQEFLFQRLGQATDQGEGIFSNIKEATKDIARQKRGKEEKERNRKYSQIIYGKSRPVELEVASKDIIMPTGVTISQDKITVEAATVRSIPVKYRDLFIATCAVIEKSLGKDVPQVKIKKIIEQISKLFAEQ